LGLLLVSYNQRYSANAEAEVWIVFSDIGDGDVKIRRTRFPGLFMVETRFNPLEAVEKLREYLKNRPNQFKYTLKYVPIQKLVKTDLEEIKKAVEELKADIKEGETFRITVNRRGTTLDRMLVIEEVAKLIQRKVNLSHPDKIVQIEILGRKTGVSVLKPDHILSVPKLKRVLGLPEEE